MSGAPVLLLPLDSRPVCLDAPAQLADVAGIPLALPPRAWLGHFLAPGQPEGLASWLAQAAADARAAIISLDMLAYGGLVASRTPAVSADDAVRRLEVLRALKERRPDLRILAFNVIMRLTITGADPETRAAGRDIFRYSVLRDQAERLGDSEAAHELPAVAARIPPALLAAYLAARARNHAVNRAALELLAEGVLDFLALVQEDTAPTGLHVAEQLALTALARARVPEGAWRLYAGTDEAAQTLLAREHLREMGMAFPVAVHFRDPATAAYPALFEDVPLRETVHRHIDAVGGTLEPTGLRLAAHTFTPPQPDLFELPPPAAPTWQSALDTFPDTGAATWLAGFGHAPLAIADLAYCNGGDPHLLAALLGAPLARCRAYAGWNTAGNTLGATLAHAALRTAVLAQGTDNAREDAQRRAVLTRILDDGVYQPIVRPWVAARVQEFGASPLNLENMAHTAEVQVNALLHDCWRELCAGYPGAAALDRPFRATLPWGRLFEIHLEFPSEGEG